MSTAITATHPRTATLCLLATHYGPSDFRPHQFDDFE